MWKHQRTRQAIISFWSDTREEAEQFFSAAAERESFGFSWIMEKEKIYGLALSLGEEGTAFLPADGSLRGGRTGTFFSERSSGRTAGLWKNSCSAGSASPSWISFTVPGPGERLFDLSIGAYLDEPAEGPLSLRGYREGISGPAASRQSRSFSVKLPWKRQRRTERRLQKLGLLSGLCGGSGTGTQFSR